MQQGTNDTFLKDINNKSPFTKHDLMSFNFANPPFQSIDYLLEC